MRAFTALSLAGCLWVVTAGTSSADVQISMHDGQVSIKAKDATVRQILTEWARIGRTRIVNVERIAGGPVTIELNNVPEQDALDLLLRTVSGYIAAPRAPVVADASQFDRIIVMPTSAAPRPAAAPASPAAPPAPFAQLNGILQPPEDDDNRLPGGVALPPALAPIFSNFPQAQGGNPRRPATPTLTPGVFGSPQLSDPQFVPQLPQPSPSSAPSAQPGMPPGAVSAPGMIAPAPGLPGVLMPPGVQPRRPNDN
jgi:hypothetical protein